MDALIQLLMTKYGMPPEQAKSFAAKYFLGTDQESSAMRGWAAQMQTEEALNTMRAGEAQMAQMKQFQQSDPVSAEALQRAQQIMAEGTRRMTRDTLNDRDNQNPPTMNDSNFRPVQGFDQGAYDAQDYEFRKQAGTLDHYTQETMPDEVDEDTKAAMRKDYLAADRPKMDDAMRAAYLRAAAKAPKHMVVRLADNGE
jgi:hypothetical protein